MRVTVNGRDISGAAVDCHEMKERAIVNVVSGANSKQVRDTVFLGMATYTGDMTTASQPLIAMVQDLAFPVGICMSSWGLIEMMLGNPAGKEKVKWTVICYTGIHVIPMVFMQIRAAFQ